MPTDGWSTQSERRAIDFVAVKTLSQSTRERVTSKGGTTYAALASMEESGVKAAIVTAVKAAAARGRELGEQMGKDG